MRAYKYTDGVPSIWEPIDLPLPDPLLWKRVENRLVCFGPGVLGRLLDMLCVNGIAVRVAQPLTRQEIGRKLSLGDAFVQADLCLPGS